MNGQDRQCSLSFHGQVRTHWVIDGRADQEGNKNPQENHVKHFLADIHCHLGRPFPPQIAAGILDTFEIGLIRASFATSVMRVVQDHPNVNAQP